MFFNLGFSEYPHEGLTSLTEIALNALAITTNPDCPSAESALTAALREWETTKAPHLDPLVAEWTRTNCDEVIAKFQSYDQS